MTASAIASPLLRAHLRAPARGLDVRQLCEMWEPARYTIRSARPAARRVATAAAAPTGSAASSSKKRVCVLGAGVAGLTSAVQLLERVPGLEVTLVAEQWDSETTSYGAGGLWKPYTLGSTPPQLVNKWGLDTFEHYMGLYMSPAAAEAGVMLTSAYQLWGEQVPDPEWAQVVPHFRHLTPRELQLYDPSHTHSHGWFYTTVITEGRFYMSFLMTRFRRLGGGTLCRRVQSLEELAPYDLVVNCLGLGARELFGDTSMYPVRGQVLRVRAPWVRHYTNADGDCYIIPNTDTVVVGGTLQKDDWDLTPRQEDTDGILARAYAVMPSLRAAKLEKVWVGLRPGRPSVRLEKEALQLESRSAPLPVVHNYGHGGAGLTLAWGCAKDVVQLADPEGVL